MFWKKRPAPPVDKQKQIDDIMAIVRDQLGERERAVKRREDALNAASTGMAELLTIATHALRDAGFADLADHFVKLGQQKIDPVRSVK